MFEEQDIYMGSVVVGQASLQRQGLYVLISCRCDLPAGQIYRLCIHFLDSKIPLGVCVPDNGCFFLQKRIASKRLGTNAYKIVVETDNPGVNLPIQTYGQADYLHRLSCARFCRKDGAAYIHFSAQ